MIIEASFKNDHNAKLNVTLRFDILLNRGLVVSHIPVRIVMLEKPVMFGCNVNFNVVHDCHIEG